MVLTGVKLTLCLTAWRRYSRHLLVMRLSLREENFPVEDLTSFLSATFPRERISGHSSGLMIFSEGRPVRSMCCFWQAGVYILQGRWTVHWRLRPTAVTYCSRVLSVVRFCEGCTEEQKRLRLCPGSRVLVFRWWRLCDAGRRVFSLTRRRCRRLAAAQRSAPA